jgi:hypothetical protein
VTGAFFVIIGPIQGSVPLYGLRLNLMCSAGSLVI